MVDSSHCLLLAQSPQCLRLGPASKKGLVVHTNSSSHLTTSQEISQAVLLLYVLGLAFKVNHASTISSEPGQSRSIQPSSDDHLSTTTGALIMTRNGNTGLGQFDRFLSLTKGVLHTSFSTTAPEFLTCPEIEGESFLQSSFLFEGRQCALGKQLAVTDSGPGRLYPISSCSGQSNTIDNSQQQMEARRLLDKQTADDVRQDRPQTFPMVHRHKCFFFECQTKSNTKCSTRHHLRNSHCRARFKFTLFFEAGCSLHQLPSKMQGSYVSSLKVEPKFLNSKFLNSKFLNSKILSSKFLENNFLTSKFLVFRA